jgi:hypothetical protein
MYFIPSEDDFEIKSKVYSLNLHLVLNHILYSQDVLSFRNLVFTLFFLILDSPYYVVSRCLVFSEFVFYFTSINKVSEHWTKNTGTLCKKVKSILRNLQLHY